MMQKPKIKFSKNFMTHFGQVTEEFGPLTINSKSDVGGRACTKTLRNLWLLALNATYNPRSDIEMSCILPIYLLCIFNG